MFLRRIHLAEGLAFACRNEDRIEAEAFLPTRGPDEVAFDGALEDFLMPVRPDDGEGGDETGAAVLRTDFGKELLDLSIAM